MSDVCVFVCVVDIHTNTDSLWEGVRKRSWVGLQCTCLVHVSSCLHIVFHSFVDINCRYVHIRTCSIDINTKTVIITDELLALFAIFDVL